ncbi:MAG: NADP-specific glutamate dehydrogenase [Lachnospiraceae bacterium]|nr:NADP-specific glutamate dehydrogenase [Lachnospiraceae bacterium]MBQ6353568.1 NADP-specific glutamate dehydrogenase [Lachnospiraceae bacterium]MBR2752773.1 NADP-specific glutamate dehydrogenase [Lachnospiraceae bacterium]
MSKYVDQVIANVKEKHGNEPEFVQTVEEVLSSLAPVIDQHPEYEKVDLLGRMVEPERMFTFRVVWEDDNGNIHTNIGYRCQFNGAIGPYKGGLRFQPNVYPGIIKFLGFEQIFKNALTGLPIGGGKGGSDFDPAGKSDAEIMRFCQSFMTALYRYIGPDIDVPAGDMGVGGREIGFLYGQYRRLKGMFQNGVLTGKDLSFGGSLIRPEATGYGAVYYLNEVLEHENDTIKGKTIACAGFGNVTWGICKKAAELGAKVITLSGPDGYIVDPDGVVTDEKINYLLEMRASGRNVVKDYADKFGVEFFPGEKPWGVKADIIMPSAMQNDVNMEQAKKIAANHPKYYIEVANMPTTNDALEFLKGQDGMIVAPSKAVNAGGVAVSALEMSQNSERISWTAKEVDEMLKKIMHDIHKNSADAAEKYGLGYDLVAGANIAGFDRVAQAMMGQGVF